MKYKFLFLINLTHNNQRISFFFVVSSGFFQHDDMCGKPKGSENIQTDLSNKFVPRRLKTVQLAAFDSVECCLFDISVALSL